MPPFNVFKVFGSTKRNDAPVYPYTDSSVTNAPSGRRVLRRRDTRRGTKQQPPQIAHPPTLTAISEDDMSRYSRYPPFGEHDHFPAVTPSAVPSAIYESEAGPPHQPHEIHASVEPDRPRGVQLVDPPVRSHPQLHEHFTNSDDERSDGMDERSSRRRVDIVPSQPHSHSRSRSSHSRSHSNSHSRITQAPYMGRAQTPYHASEASVAESHPSDIRIQPEYLPEAQVPSSLPSRAAPPPVARQPTSERMPRSHDDRASSRRPTKTQAPQHQYTPYVHPVQPTRAYSNSRRDNNMSPPSKNHYDAQPPFPLGVDANTYCYIVPRGTNVIFQDEDGHEITRIGQFQHPSNRSEDTLDYESPTRKRTVPIIVQDEYGQELYRTGSITHRSFDNSDEGHGHHELPSMYRGRSRSMSSPQDPHRQQGILPYAHTGPNIVLVDHSGHQIPIATNPYRTADLHH